MTSRQIIATAILSIVISAMLSCGVALCRAEVSGATEDRIPVIKVTTDPNASLVGSIVAGEIVRDDDGREGTSLRIHPVMTYSLYDETILFCGDESVRVTTVDGALLQGNFAFIYRREASRLIKGVPCFSLRTTYKVVAK